MQNITENLVDVYCVWAVNCACRNLWKVARNDRTRYRRQKCLPVWTVTSLQLQV